ncbi:family 10 glycosylhydrolase [Deferrisoma palaeochoriense]
MPLAMAVFLLVLAGCAAGTARRAAWLVRDRLADPAELTRACEAAKTAGLERLVVQVRGRGDAWYPSEVAPRAEPLRAAPEGHDPLALALEACAPVPVAAWLNVYYLWGDETPPADPAHPARAHPEWVLTDDEGRRVDGYGPVERALGWIEGIYADPASLGYRDLFVEVVQELVAAYPVGEIHLDFVRYPGPGYGQGGPLGERFRETWGLDPRLLPPELRDAPDLAAWLDGSMPAGDRILTTLGLLWAEARAREVTALVRAVRRELDRVEGRRVRLSAAVWPDPGSSYRDKGQDWRTWAAEGLVDALYPMAYFGPPARVEAQARRALAAVGPWGTELWLGLGGYVKAPAQIREEARRAAVGRYCLFDWGTLLDRPGGPGPWVEALGGRFVPPVSHRAPPAPRTEGGRRLWALVDRAVGGDWAGLAVPDGALDRRWAEFEAARQGVLSAAVEAAARSTVTVPDWVDLEGIFRYVNPDDPPERVAEQASRAREALERVRAGEDFGRVAREVSQGGTARFGGPLGRRYLTEGLPGREALAAARPGDLVGPVRVSNGFWVYRVRERGQGRAVPFSEAPWPARRNALRRILASTGVRLGGQEAGRLGGWNARRLGG